MLLQAKVKTDVITVTTATTRVALGSGVKAHKLRVKALPGNAGVVYFGDVTVAAANGYVLAAGAELVLDSSDHWDQSNMPEFDLSQLYVDAATNGDKVSILYVRF